MSASSAKPEAIVEHKEGCPRAQLDASGIDFDPPLAPGEACECGDDEPTTLKEWLENNRSIMEQEHEPEHEIEKNQMETIRAFAEKVVSTEWAKNMNEEYGYPDGVSVVNGYRGYAPEDMFDPEVIEAERKRRDLARADGDEFISVLSPRDLSNRAPLTTDLVQFVLWLHETKSVIEMEHEWDDAVLARLALEYTGE